MATENLPDQQPNFSREQPAPSPNSINRSEIAKRVATLLSHYWTGDEDARLRQEQVKDWVGDLEHFGAAIVAGACAEWRQTETRRPLPANIIVICARMRDDKMVRHQSVQESVARIGRVVPLVDAVRDNWRTLKYWDLSEAEQKLFRKNARDKIEGVR